MVPNTARVSYVCRWQRSAEHSLTPDSGYVGVGWRARKRRWRDAAVRASDSVRDLCVLGCGCCG
eukprot:7147739-Prymnesium_polylepis.1